MIDAGFEAIRANGWEFPEDVWQCLGEADRAFAVLEFTGTRTASYYERRLSALGFRGLERVLDAGCGMGQWSLAASRLNGSIEGIDLNSGRLLIAQRLAQASGAGNVQFRNGCLERLPFDAASFDGIFCYGVFMFAAMPRALAEFRRVLRPGGRLYLNANSWGWYAHLLFDRALAGGQLRLARNVFTTVLRTLMLRESQIIVTRGRLESWLAAAGFDGIELATEGALNLEREAAIPAPEPAYPERFYGLEAILEALCRRS